MEKTAVTRLKPAIDNSWGIASDKLRKDLGYSQPVETKSLIDPAKLSVASDIKDASNSLEFLLCTLSNKFKLSPLQV